MYLSQFQEMKAYVSLCKCVDSPEPLLPTYTKYRFRPELRQLTPLRQWTINAGFCQYVISTKISHAGQIFI